jgi:hypothetical protein
MAIYQQGDKGTFLTISYINLVSKRWNVVDIRDVPSLDPDTWPAYTYTYKDDADLNATATIHPLFMDTTAGIENGILTIFDESTCFLWDYDSRIKWQAFNNSSITSFSPDLWNSGQFSTDSNGSCSIWVKGWEPR